jgi:N-acetyl-anhydromuramyl-L-alanine amidase AmpD
MADTSWTVNIDQSLLSEAQERARLENQDLDQVVQRLLQEWLSSPAVTPQAAAELPADLQVEYIQSPHYEERPPDTRIWAIVIHATANDSMSGVIEWFTDPQSLVSAHYNVDKDGRVVQMAREEQRAWHAGKSQWKGVESVNDFSIGIELVNRNDGVDPYPQEQYQVCLKLCKYLVDKYGIKPEDIVSHRAISLTGKTDPAGFDMDRLRRDVAAGQADG